jgi:hypothetical protein
MQQGRSWHCATAERNLEKSYWKWADGETVDQPSSAGKSEFANKSMIEEGE